MVTPKGFVCVVFERLIGIPIFGFARTLSFVNWWSFRYCRVDAMAKPSICAVALIASILSMAFHMPGFDADENPHNQDSPNPPETDIGDTDLVGGSNTTDFWVDATNEGLADFLPGYTLDADRKPRPWGQSSRSRWTGGFHACSWRPPSLWHKRTRRP